MYDGFILFLGTTDLEKVDRFYAGLLGCQQVIDQKSCRIYKVSEQGFVGFCLHFEKKDLTSQSPILTFVTERVDSVYEKLKAANIKVDGLPRLNPKFNIYHFFATDFDGYRVEIQEFVNKDDARHFKSPAFLSELQRIATNKNQLDPEHLRKTVSKWGRIFGEYQIARMLLKVHDVPVDALERTFQFAFDKYEFIGKYLQVKGTVLSIGCGLGQIETALGEQGYKVVGVDTDTDLVSVATSISKTNPVSSQNVKFMKVNSTELPFPDQYFDTVMYISSLHEMKEKIKSLHEAHRVLKSQGILIIGEDELTWTRLSLINDIATADFVSTKKENLPSIFDHGGVSPYIIRYFRKET